MTDETFECVCGACGTISETDAGDGYAVIVCARCGWQMRATGIALIQWAHRSSRTDEDGERWKSLATL